MSYSSSSLACKCPVDCVCKTGTRQIASPRWLRVLPNALTAFRLCLLPVFASFLWHGSYGAAALTYLIALLTDIDGHIARRWGGVTKFGAVFDPVVDAVFMLVALGMLTGLGRVALLPVAAYLVSVAFRALPTLAHFRATQSPATSLLSKAIAFCGFGTVVLATLGTPLMVTALVLWIGAIANIALTVHWLRAGTFSY